MVEHELPEAPPLHIKCLRLVLEAKRERVAAAITHQQLDSTHSLDFESLHEW